MSTAFAWTLGSPRLCEVLEALQGPQNQKKYRETAKPSPNHSPGPQTPYIWALQGPINKKIAAKEPQPSRMPKNKLPKNKLPKNKLPTISSQKIKRCSIAKASNYINVERLV
jgi:hypothetical protein